MLMCSVEACCIHVGLFPALRSAPLPRDYEEKGFWSGFGWDICFGCALLFSFFVSSQLRLRRCALSRTFRMPRGGDATSDVSPPTQRPFQVSCWVYLWQREQLTLRRRLKQSQIILMSTKNATLTDCHTIIILYLHTFYYKDLKGG